MSSGLLDDTAAAFGLQPLRRFGAGGEQVCFSEHIAHRDDETTVRSKWPPPSGGEPRRGEAFGQHRRNLSPLADSDESKGLFGGRRGTAHSRRARSLAETRQLALREWTARRQCGLVNLRGIQVGGDALSAHASAGEVPSGTDAQCFWVTGTHFGVGPTDRLEQPRL